MILEDKIQFLCDSKKPLRYKETLMHAFSLSKQRHHDAEFQFHHGDKTTIESLVYYDLNL